MTIARIKKLDSTLINQIAAGEVLERPAAALKEIVENAIDAGSTRIDVTLRDGGRTFLQVQDNGSGMDKENLMLCVERHATSKLPNNNLFEINTLGFRGEALPSIGAVSRLHIETKCAQEEQGWQLKIEGGQRGDVLPCAMNQGTRVTIRDLFFATPARLKFLKTSQTEYQHCVDYLKRLAMSKPDISFSFKNDDRLIFQYQRGSQESRLRDVLGKEFVNNTCAIQVNRPMDELQLHGWISLPTYHRSQASEQYLFVNGRHVRDKLLATAVRVAYQDLIAPNRHPSLVLFLHVPFEDVDVNVHPAKSEVRFKDSQTVRSFIISTLQQTLLQNSQQTASYLAEKAVAYIKPAMANNPSFNKYPSPFRTTYQQSALPQTSVHAFAYEAPQPKFSDDPIILVLPQTSSEPTIPLPMGMACTQIHETYVIAQTSDSIIIVDQHAAHERLVYEKLKQQHLGSQSIATQSLTIPEIISLSDNQHAWIKQHLGEFEKFGFGIELFGHNEIMIRQIPALLSNSEIKVLILDMIDDWMSTNQSLALEERICEILASAACHQSIRAGKKLNHQEMNALLRQMEETPYSAQCNHGRPTYVELKKSDIEKLFGRA